VSINSRIDGLKRPSLDEAYKVDDCSKKPLAVQPRDARASDPGVALQVAFERQILKPVFHLIGFRLWV
jgi:hypothetical protein